MFLVDHPGRRCLSEVAETSAHTSLTTGGLGDKLLTVHFTATVAGTSTQKQRTVSRSVASVNSDSIMGLGADRCKRVAFGMAWLPAPSKTLPRQRNPDKSCKTRGKEMPKKDFSRRFDLTTRFTLGYDVLSAQLDTLGSRVQILPHPI